MMILVVSGISSRNALRINASVLVSTALVGTSEELLQTNEIYREVYESQVKGGEEDE